MEITVQREPSQGGATIGQMCIDGTPACYTLEDDVREVAGEPVSSWKIRGATAIPAGRYKVTLEQSGRFGADTPTIHNVPGFEYIRMHAGNTSADTEGCLLLGMQVTATGIVGGTSRAAVTLVKESIRRALDGGDEVWIEISNAQGVA